MSKISYSSGVRILQGYIPIRETDVLHCIADLLWKGCLTNVTGNHVVCSHIPNPCTASFAPNIKISGNQATVPSKGQQYDSASLNTTYRRNLSRGTVQGSATKIERITHTAAPAHTVRDRINKGHSIRDEKSVFPTIASFKSDALSEETGFTTDNKHNRGTCIVYVEPMVAVYS